MAITKPIVDSSIGWNENTTDMFTSAIGNLPNEEEGKWQNVK